MIFGVTRPNKIHHPSLRIDFRHDDDLHNNCDGFSGPSAGAGCQRHVSGARTTASSPIFPDDHGSSRHHRQSSGEATLADPLADPLAILYLSHFVFFQPIQRNNNSLTDTDGGCSDPQTRPLSGTIGSSRHRELSSLNPEVVSCPAAACGPNTRRRMTPERALPGTPPLIARPSPG